MLATDDVRHGEEQVITATLYGDVDGGGGTTASLVTSPIVTAPSSAIITFEAATGCVRKSCMGSSRWHYRDAAGHRTRGDGNGHGRRWKCARDSGNRGPGRGRSE